MPYAGTQDVYDLSGLGTLEAGTALVTRLLGLIGDPSVDSYTRKHWSGEQTKELIGRGDGTLAVFWSHLKPILSALDSSNGTITTDPAHVTLRQDGTTVASANYTLIGAEGRIEFDSGWEPDSDDKLELTYFYDMEPFKTASALYVCGALYDNLGGEESEKRADQFKKRAEEILKPYRQSGYVH